MNPQNRLAGNAFDATSERLVGRTKDLPGSLAGVIGPCAAWWRLRRRRLIHHKKPRISRAEANTAAITIPATAPSETPPPAEKMTYEAAQS